MGRAKGVSKKKNHSKVDVEPNELVNAPHSFVLSRGLPCHYVNVLTKDFRRMMEPFTASALKGKNNKNKIKDFVNVSGLLHVTHMCILQKAKSQISFKVARLPRGPTLSFKVHQFTLVRDVLASLRKQYLEEEAFRHAPLVILNNFTGEGKHLKLMATMFQNMFPTINLATVQLSTMKRCVLISYNPVTELIDIRHYAITVVPVGLSRNVKKVVMGKIPNLARWDDIADFITGETATDSEIEDDETNQVVLSQTLKSRGNIEDNKSAIKLHEIGPRLTMELLKVEGGLFTGEVLYHRNIIKSEEEKAAIMAERNKKKQLKMARRKQQEQNALNKAHAKDEHKKKCLAGMKRKSDDNQGQINEEEEDDHDDDDDAAYYKEELGEEPDKDLFTGVPSQRRPFIPKYQQMAKKRKIERDNRNTDKTKKLNMRNATKKTKSTKSTKSTLGHRDVGKKRKFNKK